MGIIEDYLALDLPLAVDRCIRMGRRLGLSRSYEPLAIEQELRTELFSLLLGARRDAQYFQAKQCYFNAQMALIASRHSSLDGRLEYCEGLYASPSLPMAIPHAWNVLDGKYIVDTTLVANVRSNRDEGLADRFIGNFPKGHEYEGLCIDGDFVIDRLKSAGESISILDDYQARFPYMRMLEKKIKEL